MFFNCISIRSSICLIHWFAVMVNSWFDLFLFSKSSSLLISLFWLFFLSPSFTFSAYHLHFLISSSQKSLFQFTYLIELRFLYCFSLIVHIFIAFCFDSSFYIFLNFGIYSVGTCYHWYLVKNFESILKYQSSFQIEK